MLNIRPKRFFAFPTPLSYGRFINYRFGNIRLPLEKLDVCLRFNKQPTLCSFLFEAYAHGIIHKNSPSLINSSILLYFRTNSEERINAKNMLLEHYPRVTLPDYQASGDIHISSIIDSDKPDIDSNELLKITLRLVSDANYIYSIVDLFYVPKSIAYLRFHLRHELLIMGIDGRKKQFLAANFASNGTFDIVGVPFNLYVAGFLSRSGIKEGFDYCKRYRLDGICCNSENHAKIDLHAIRIQLFAYLNSCKISQSLINNNKTLKSALSRTDIMPLFETGYFGLSVYKHLIDYFRDCGKAANIDMRVTRSLADSKRLMKTRTRALSVKLGLGPDGGNSKCETIAELAHATHLLCYEAKHDRTLSPIARMCDNMNRLLEMEEGQMRSLLKVLA